MTHPSTVYLWSLGLLVCAVVLPELSAQLRRLHLLEGVQPSIDNNVIRKNEYRVKKDT